MYLTLNYILQNLISIFCAITISFALTPKFSRLRSLFVYFVVTLYLYGIKFHFFENQLVLQLSMYSIQIALLLFLLLSFKDSLFKKLIVFSIIFFCNIMTEYIGLLILNSFGTYMFALAPDSKEFFLAIVLALPVQILLNLVFLFFWKYTEYKTTTALFIFTLIPMLQLLINSCILVPSLLNEKMLHTPLPATCSLVALITTIILFYTILHRQEKQSIQTAYLELQELYHIESEYYQELEARHEELAKIRHDYNNQLSALYILISSGQIEAAKELASSIEKQMK